MVGEVSGGNVEEKDETQDESDEEVVKKKSKRRKLFLESNAYNDGLSLANEETATDANIPFPKMISPVTSIALKLKSLSDEELVKLGAQLSNQATTTGDEKTR